MTPNQLSFPAAFLIATSVFSSCGSTSASTEINASREKTPFSVISCTPQGELPDEVHFPSIQMQFSEPVVALEKLGEPSNQNDAFTITPAMKGTFRWYGTSLLSFDCSEELIPQKIYTVTVNKNLTSLNGNKISGTLVFTFHTEPLRITDFEPGYRTDKGCPYYSSNDIPPEYAQNISVGFSNKINASVIAKYISISDNSKKSYPFTAKQLSDSSVLIKISDTLPCNTDFTFTLLKGAIPDKDCCSTDKDLTQTFHTLRPVEYEHADGTANLSIVFNHKIKDGLEQKIYDSLSFNPSFIIKKENISITWNRITVSDLPVTYGSKYSFTLKGGAVTDIFSQTYDKDISETIQVPDADSFASFKNQGNVILESQFVPAAAFEYQNISGNSSYTVTPVSGTTASYKPGKPLTYDITVEKSETNRRIIRTADLSSCLEKTEKGFRGAALFESIITTKRGKEKNTDSYRTLYQATDLGVTVRSAYNKSVIFVTSLSTGEAVQGAAVKILNYSSSDDKKDNTDALIAVLCGKGNKTAEGKTDSTGCAVITFEKYFNSSPYIFYEVTTADDRVVFQAEHFSYYYHPAVFNTETAGTESVVPSRAVVCMFTDRGLYKPGETVTVKCIDRTLRLSRYTTYSGGYTITFTDNGWSDERKTIATVSGKVTAEGTCSAECKLPEDLKPGTYRIEYRRSDSSNETESTSFTVQYFERLRFQADASIPAVTWFRGDTVSADIKASYLGGGALSGGTCHADWWRGTIYFAPAGKRYEGMHFGPKSESPYYFRDTNDSDYKEYHEQSDDSLNSEGTVRIHASTGTEEKDGSAYMYSLEAQITDSGNQMIAEHASAIVHPAYFYIGLGTDDKVKGFAKKGTTLSFPYAFACPDGSAPSINQFSTDKKITWELVREDWQEISKPDEYGYPSYEWKQVNITEHTDTVSVSDTTAVEKISVTPENGGRYILRLSSQDSNGRKIVTEQSFFVTSSDWYFHFDENENKEIKITNDKEVYNPGDTAHLLINSPLAKGNYLVTVERSGIISEKIISSDSPVTVIDIPVKEDYLPVVYISISGFSVRDGKCAENYDTNDTHKPFHVSGFTSIPVNHSVGKFDITIHTDKRSYRPGETAEITADAVKDGKPIDGAELTVVVTDRGVTDLIAYTIPDPVEHFYNESLFSDDCGGIDSRDYLADPVTYGTYTLSAKESELRMFNRMYKTASFAEEPEMCMENAVALSDSAVSDSSDIQIRKDFRPTALFVPSVTTDKNGRAKIIFKLPDTLTEYTITVTGAHGNAFAKSSDKLIAANPVSVRDALPRMLRLNDKGESGVVITNTGDNAAEVAVSCGVISGLEKTGYKPEAGEIVKQNGKGTVTGENEKTISVAPGETSALMFTVEAEESGWITVAFTVKSKDVNEVIYKPLQIEKPYITETVTTEGEVRGTADELKSNAQEQIVIPADADDNYGHITVTLDATRLGTLRNAADYVFHYPYGCLEQKSSALLPLIAFGKYIHVFGIESEVKDAKSVCEKEIESWADCQRKDGGFPYWKDGRESSLAVSMRIGEVISLAEEKGVTVSRKINRKALASYISSSLNEMKKEDNCPLYPLAYGYYILSRLGGKVSDSDIADMLKNENCGLSEYAFAGLTWLAKGKLQQAEFCAEKCRQYFTLTTRSADIPSGNNIFPWYFFNSDSEQYALALHLFTLVNPEDIYIRHIVYQLLQIQNAHNGYWYTTAATARVFIALDKYIAAEKLEDTDFSAKALLGGNELAFGTFSGAGAGSVTTEETFSDKKLSPIERDKNIPLVFEKDGKGILFYTASIEYAIPAAQQSARDEGICLYTEITDARTGEKIKDGKLRAGTIYREKIHISTNRTRTYTALRAPVPAGAEILNAAFVTTGTVPAENSANSDVPWFRNIRYGLSHQDIYDSEIRYFWDYFPAGSETVEFLFRAERRGTYTTPSSKAECMYEPEIFGRTAGAVWTIE